MKTIGIVGLGLIGGSFARSYKVNDSEFGVYAQDIDKNVLQLAHLTGAIDGELTRERFSNCDCILICLHTALSIDWLKENSPFIPKSCLVIDCCGAKRSICAVGFEMAAKYGFEYVGGHPMAGVHRWGFKNSTADMYKGETFVVVPPRHDDINLLGRVKSYIAPTGFAHFAVTTAERHDRIIAFTSQLAHVVSNAYVKSPTARDHKGFSAGSYRDLTRVAWLNPTMWSDLFIENGDNLLFEIDGLIARLKQYRDAIAAKDEKTLARLLDEGRRAKEEIDG